MFAEYDKFANLANGSVKHLSPAKALEKLGFRNSVIQAMDKCAEKSKNM